MFLSGALSLSADESVDVISQTEMGDGYPDIIIDNTRNREAVLLELKKAAGNKFSQLEKRAEAALDVDALVREALDGIEQIRL